MKLIHVMIYFTFAVSASCGGQQGVQELGFGGYWYVLPVPKTHFERVGEHGLHWKCNDWELLVDENESISFNGSDYGAMSRGDELKVSWDGKVFLNDEEIFPIDPAGGRGRTK